MTMKDWVEHIEKIFLAIGEDLLKGNGSISKEQMVEKVEEEYIKYINNTLSAVEKDYLEEIKILN